LAFRAQALTAEGAKIALTSDLAPFSLAGVFRLMNRAVRVHDTAVERASALTLVRRGVAPTPDVATVSAPTDAWHGFVGQSAEMRQLYARLTRVAATDVPVLLAGESGTGKALAARALHALSARHRQPFVTLNCSSLPPEALELELFGATRGGLLEAADGGSVFLDEIGDLSPGAQARLWRVLEDGVVTRPAGTASANARARTSASSSVRRVNVRVLAASHRPLDRLVAEGRFRDDLLYRLRIVTVTMPALRTRVGDLALLIDHFAQALRARHDLAARPFDAAAQACLERHTWPGNVRELRNVIESAWLLADGPLVTVRDLPPALTQRAAADLTAADLTAADPTDAHVAASAMADRRRASSIARDEALTFAEARERALRDFDRAFLREALERHNGNVARTARALGLHRQSLQKLIARRDVRAPHVPSSATSHPTESMECTTR
jgi:DNA-binding NtrC family response regulator